MSTADLRMTWELKLAVHHAINTSAILLGDYVAGKGEDGATWRYRAAPIVIPGTCTASFPSAYDAT